MAGVGREGLLAKLAQYQPLDEQEARMMERLLLFVEEHADCFERTLEQGHVTGSAWIVDHSRTFTLLTRHRKLDKWLQLGGHADGDPDVLRVALREAREESGLEAIEPITEDIFDIDIHEIPARKTTAAHLHYDVRFLLEADWQTPLAISAESRALAWVELDRVAELNPEESVTRMVAKTRSLFPTVARRHADGGR
jgi:8-oxo-dGTP pyrophosphatase MutT (NUDIX family)